MIDGREVPSASGRSFTDVDPSTGDELTEVAFGEAAEGWIAASETIVVARMVAESRLMLLAPLRG